MHARVEELTLRSVVCDRGCGEVLSPREVSLVDATGVAVLHDAQHHSGFDSEGEDG